VVYRWNGSDWDKVGDGLSQMMVDGGGRLFALDPTQACVSRWNGSGWDRVAGGGALSQIAVDGVGPAFDLAATTHTVYRWPSGGWESAGGGVKGRVVDGPRRLFALVLAEP